MKFELRSWLCAGVTASALALGAVPAFAAGSGDDVTKAAVYNGLTLDQMKSIITSAGASTSDLGDNTVRIADGPLVQLTQCPPEEKGVCYEIQIERTFSNVKPPLDAVNKWNSDTKIPEASIDDNGHLHLEFWVTTVGITAPLLIDSIGWFEGAWQDESSQQFWAPYMKGAGT